MKSETKIKGARLSRAAFMEVFGVNWAKTETYISEGMPVVTRGGLDAGGKPRPWVFDSVACWRYILARAARLGREARERQANGDFLKQLHPDDPRHRVAVAQAERLEHAHEKEAGETLAKEDAVEIVDEIFGMLREHFGKLPGTIVGSLGATGEKAAKVERMLEREVTAALSGLDASAIAEIEVESESEDELA